MPVQGGHGGGPLYHLCLSLPPGPLPGPVPQWPGQEGNHGAERESLCPLPAPPPNVTLSESNPACLCGWRLVSMETPKCDILLKTAVIKRCAWGGLTSPLKGAWSGLLTGVGSACSSVRWCQVSGSQYVCIHPIYIVKFNSFFFLNSSCFTLITIHRVSNVFIIFYYIA